MGKPKNEKVPTVKLSGVRVPESEYSLLRSYYPSYGGVQKVVCLLIRRHLKKLAELDNATVEAILKEIEGEGELLGKEIA